MSAIDWTDPGCPISSYFTVRDALWLPRWSRLAAPGDGLSDDSYAALLALFQKLDAVREYLDRKVRVHVAYRPKAYNLEIDGAHESCHMARRESGALLAAVDWDAEAPGEEIGESCDKVRALLLPKLEEWGLRMENPAPKAPWIHLDTRPVPIGGNRFFKP